MKFKKVQIIILSIILLSVICFVACSSNQLSSWNNNVQSLQQIKDYVDDVTNPSSPNFIPKEDRIVVSDNDGTLYGEKAPLYYDCVLYVDRVLHDPSYTATDQQIDLAHKLEQCFINHDLDAATDKIISADYYSVFAGMTIDEYIVFCDKLFEKEVSGFSGIKYKDFFYKPMKELVNYLQKKEFNFYIVTGVDRIAARELIKGELNIEPDHIIGTDGYLRLTGNPSLDQRDYKLQSNDKIVLDSKQIIKDTNSSKVMQIIQEIGKQPVLSIGNSSGDESMAHYVTKNNKYKSQAIMVLQDDNDRDNALLVKAEKSKKTWESNGWIVVSIKNDWNTIYGNDATKINN